MLKYNEIYNRVQSREDRTQRIKAKGFTLIEVLVVLGVMGILMLAAYPSVQQTLDKRSLESAARDPDDSPGGEIPVG